MLTITEKKVVYDLKPLQDLSKYDKYDTVILPGSNDQDRALYSCQEKKKGGEGAPFGGGAGGR
jgi:hypothetical protein